MAPPRKIPSLDTNPGFKTSTVRMPNAQFEEIDLFARAMGISMNEYLRKAADYYTKHKARDPEVRKSVQKQVNRVSRMMERIAQRVLEDDAAEADDDAEELEEVDDDDDGEEEDDD